MAARRRYTWIWQPLAVPCPWLDVAATAAEEVLADLCETQPQFYSEPQVTGTAFGFVEIHLTVSAKDQWKIPWRVRRKLLPHLAAAMAIHPMDLEQRSSEKLPPHRHPSRGARWRQAQM